MSAIEITRPVSSGFHRLATRTVASLSAWNDARKTRKALSQLSDHQLDDIGLIRGDIDQIAAGG